jgi:hypothetical protein
VFVDPSDGQLGLLTILQILRDFFLDLSLSVIGRCPRRRLGLKRGMWMLGSKYVDLHVMDLSLFPSFVDGIR